MQTMAKEAGTALREARSELGWTQARTIFALAHQAEVNGIAIADRSSLKTMLSRWENGRGRPDPIYQRLFCRIYGRDEDELGFSREIDRPSAPRIAPAVGSSTVDYFRTVFREHVKADNLMGPHHLVEIVHAQTALLDRVLSAARGRTREELLILACRYSEFTGWLYQDAGDPTSAMTFTDRAMDYALEINVPRVTAYVLMRKSNISCDLGKPDRALGLTEAALRDSDKVPPRVKALIFGQRCRAYAALGNQSECSRAIDQALREVARPDTDSYVAAAYCNESYVSMEAATALTILGKSSQAIPVFVRSLGAWPEHLRRDQGLCLVRLAGAHAVSEDIQQATTAGRNALTIIQSATSGRALLELTRLRHRLAPWRRDEEVSELCEQIRSLTRPAA